MRLEPDPLVSQWLIDFVPDFEAFDWDRGNQEKNLKHGFTSAQVESVFWKSYLFAGRIVEPAHEEWRGLILGETYDQQFVALIFTRRGERIRAISCRPMRVEERRHYENKTS
jgi:uncharacterized DUF497 family protein